MSLTKQIAKQIREVYFGGNWTWSNLKDNLADVTWQEATKKVDSFNTIAALVYHANYFVGAVISVLQDEPLTAHDKYSFDVPAINSPQDWNDLQNKTWADVEKFANLVEQLPEEKLLDVFAAEKYGNYYRNIHGVIQHTHYHLGQISIIKKLIKTQS